MSFKAVYYLGVMFLALGLLWLHAYDFLPTHDDHQNNSETKEILTLSLPGAIPALLGVFLMEYADRKIKKLKKLRK